MVAAIVAKGAASVLMRVLKILLSLGKGSKMGNGTTTSAVASIFQSIATLGGLLGPSLNGHTAAVRQAGEILTQIQNAATEGQWSQVLTLANSLFTIQHLSTAALNGVRAIVTASTNAVNSSSVTLGATPVQLAALNATNQQLVLAEVAALRSQLANESQGIFSHLLGIHSLTATGS